MKHGIMLSTDGDLRRVRQAVSDNQLIPRGRRHKFIRKTAGPAAIAHFHVQSVSDEYLSCKKCDPDGSYPANDTDGSEVATTKVLRANELRVSEWSGQTIPPTSGTTYTSAGSPGIERTADDGVLDPETQQIIPAYVTPSGAWLGTIIVADRLEKSVTIGADTFLWQERPGLRGWRSVCA